MSPAYRQILFPGRRQTPEQVGESLRPPSIFKGSASAICACRQFCQKQRTFFRRYIRRKGDWLGFFGTTSQTTFLFNTVIRPAFKLFRCVESQRFLKVLRRNANAGAVIGFYATKISGGNFRHQSNGSQGPIDTPSTIVRRSMRGSPAGKSLRAWVMLRLSIITRSPAFHLCSKIISSSS